MSTSTFMKGCDSSDSLQRLEVTISGRTTKEIVYVILRVTLVASKNWLRFLDPTLLKSTAAMGPWAAISLTE